LASLYYHETHAKYYLYINGRTQVAYYSVPLQVRGAQSIPGS